MSSLRNKFAVAFHKPYDLSIASNRALERQRRIALTSLTAIIYKVISSAIPLITLKITYSYLGVEVYGLWSAVTNFFALFAFSDLGLGNGLQTMLSHASGKDDLEQSKILVSSTYWVLWVVAAILLSVFIIAYPIVDWAHLMNATQQETIKLAAPVVFVIVLPKILSIPVAIISRTQLALQEGYNSNVWGIVGSLLSLIFIVLCAHFDFGKIWLLLGSSVIPLIISILNMVVYYGYQRRDLCLSYKYVKKDSIKSLLQLGISFFFLSILTTVGLSMDTFIVAKTCSLSDAASFSVIYKMSIVISSVLAIFCQPLWGANGEAIARGEYEWVRTNTQRMSRALAVITIIGSVLFVALSKIIFKIWLGPEFEFSIICLTFLCAIQVAQAFISPYFMFLNAVGIVRFQLLLFGIYTPLSFILKFYMARIYGSTAIPATGLLLYVIIIVIFSVIIARRTLKKLSRNE